jgi:hypothetical protein
MSLSLRAGALLAAGSLAVHELRYLVGYGDEGGTATAGHDYLAWVAPLVALGLAVACGAWLARIGRRDGSAPTVTWLGATLSLAGTYGVQETIEALTAPGHPGLLAHDGWVAVPIVVAVGALIALLLQGVCAVDRMAARAAHPVAPLRAEPVAPLALTLPAAACLAPRPRGLARRVAGRAPPVAS